MFYVPYFLGVYFLPQLIASRLIGADIYSMIGIYYDIEKLRYGVSPLMPSCGSVVQYQVYYVVTTCLTGCLCEAECLLLFSLA